MSTENPTNPETPPEEQFGLSIDQPTVNTNAFPPAEYDGAPASETPEPAAEVTTPAGKKLLRIDMGNGKYYTAETERELLQKVVDGKREADRYIEELKQLKQTPQPSGASVTVTPKAPVNYGDLPEKYDNQTYLNLLAEDPMKAQRYIMREMYGDLDPIETLRSTSAIAEQVKQHMTVAEFQRRNPDYQPSQQASDAIWGMIRQYGLDGNSIPNLEWAYREAQKQGMIGSTITNPDGTIEYEDISFSTPASTTNVVPIQRPSTPPPPQRRGAAAPQSVRGGGTGGDLAAPVDPWAVPLDALRESIEKKGGRRQ